MRPFGRRPDGEQGAIAVIVALSAVLLFVFAAFAVDIGKTWAKRGELQVQADQAAIAAANGLPVIPTNATDKIRVARFAAHYLACNKVMGQTFNLPVCNESLTPASTSLDVAASTMLTNGAANRAPGIRFPTTSSVEVITPAADIDYAFGKAAGVSGTDAVKRATAQVSSPGQMLPVALTRECGRPGTELNHDTLSEVRGQGDWNTASMPTRVISQGLRADPPPRNYENVPDLPAFAYPAGSRRVWDTMRFKITAPTLHLNANSWELGTAGTFWAGPDGGAAWGGLAADDDVQYWRGDGFGGWELVATSNYAGTLAGGATTIPAEVRDNAGSYWVTISVYWWDAGKAKAFTDFIPASQAKQINIVTPGFAADAQTRYDKATIAGDGGIATGGCARYFDSPRKDTSNVVVDGTSVNDSTLIKNLIGGMDHRVGLYKGIDNTCGAGKIADATVHTDASDADPNCLKIGSKNARSIEITRGWLGDPSGGTRGRLDCGITRINGKSNCPYGRFRLWGRDFNNDDLTNYMKSPMSVLTDYRKFGQANYFSDGYSLISPAPNKLSSDIYYSPRLFWAPVINTPGYNVPNGFLHGNEYPVWTYRPVWLTHQAANGTVSGAEQNLINNNTCTNDLGDLGALDRETSEYRSGLDVGIGGDYTGVILNGTRRGGNNNDRIALFNCNLSDPVSVPNFNADKRRIKGLRFQTIEPVSMPEPPLDYQGPLTDYVGSGPRIVRLVR